MKKKFNNNFVFLIVLFITIQLKAQQYEYKANIEGVNQSAFYKIAVSPDVLAKMQANKNDLRILTSENKAVGFLWNNEQAQFVDKNFIDFPIISKIVEKDKQTHVTIKNTLSASINNLLILLANTEAKRVINISGSNNNKDWFIIKENVWLDDYFKQEQSTIAQTILLPNVNYQYFQITFLGENILPTNIIKAGIYKENYIEGKYASLPLPKIKQVDSNDKRTYIWLNFGEAYNIDKLVINVSGAKYYKRILSLYQGNKINTKFPYFSYITSSTNNLLINNLKTNQILLVVDNKDDAALQFDSIKAFQLQQYMIAYLEKDKAYYIEFSDSFATKPEYDLSYFKDSIKTTLLTASIGAIHSTKNKVEPVTLKKDSNKTLLWVSVSIAAIILLFFTFRIINDINKKQ